MVLELAWLVGMVRVGVVGVGIRDDFVADGVRVVVGERPGLRGFGREVGEMSGEGDVRVQGISGEERGGGGTGVRCGHGCAAAAVHVWVGGGVAERCEGRAEWVRLEDLVFFASTGQLSCPSTSLPFSLLMEEGFDVLGRWSKLGND